MMTLKLLYYLCLYDFFGPDVDEINEFNSIKVSIRTQINYLNYECITRDTQYHT